MSRGITHETRLRLLREDAASHGLKWTEPDAVRDNESSDWTGQIHRARRVLKTQRPATSSARRPAIGFGTTAALVERPRHGVDKPPTNSGRPGRRFPALVGRV